MQSRDNRDEVASHHYFCTMEIAGPKIPIFLIPLLFGKGSLSSRLTSIWTKIEGDMIFLTLSLAKI